MRLKDIAESIRRELVDLTDGAFHVEISSDDGGYHLTISIEFHSDAQKVRKLLDEKYRNTRTVILKVPLGSLHFIRIPIV